MEIEELHPLMDFYDSISSPVSYREHLAAPWTIPNFSQRKVIEQGQITGIRELVRSAGTRSINVKYEASSLLRQTSTLSHFRRACSVQIVFTVTPEWSPFPFNNLSRCIAQPGSIYETHLLSPKVVLPAPEGSFLIFSQNYIFPCNEIEAQPL